MQLLVGRLHSGGWPLTRVNGQHKLDLVVILRKGQQVGKWREVGWIWEELQEEKNVVVGGSGDYDQNRPLPE